MSQSDSPSVAVKAALRWMIGQGMADRPDLFAYYTSHAATPERAVLASAVQMRRRMIKLGYIENNRITRAGRRAAQ